MSSSKIEKPSPISFLNVHQFLQEYYKYRKDSVPHFSYEIWSRELGLKSRSNLRMIITGKRTITEKLVSILSAKLSLNENEEVYFKTMVDYCQAKTTTQKRLLEKKLIELMRFDKDRVEVENYFDFVADPFLPRLQTLLSFDDIATTSDSLGELLGKPVHEIVRGLEKLKELDLAESNNDRTPKWHSKNKLLKVPTQFGDAALASFHTQSLKDAIQAQHLAKDLRRFRSVLLPLSGEEFNELLREIETLVQLALNRYKSDQLQNRRLYQFNLNLFSVSETPQADKS